MFVINVILDTPLSRSYSYTHPQPLNIGSRVIVDFNNRQQAGFVSQALAAADYHELPLDKLKPLLAVDNESTTLPSELWKLGGFTASYYHHSLGACLFCSVPTLFRQPKLLPEYIPLNRNYYQAIETSTPPKLRKNSRQQQLWQALTTTPLNMAQISDIGGKTAPAIINSWLAAGIITVCPPADYATTTIPLTLNNEQQQVVDDFCQQLTKFHAGLLYGITGSGKTEVFLQIIERVLAKRQQVLVLVPEINLTPQMGARFSQRFPHAEILQLNSEVSDKQRLHAWYSAKEGHCNIILGTRLSVFTTFKNLGLIIVDEEHDDSFKQSEGLRYHARNLAVWRSQQLNIPVLLASATPSLETLYNYQQGKYQLYKLTTRANPLAQLPQVELINLRHFPVNHAGISQVALEEINACLARQEMALVFINRRGYAPVITCYECGWVSSCRNCSTKMVYHHNIKRLKCHHCGHSEAVPSLCPKCRNQYLHTVGHGTQKLEEFLTQNFPTARIRRVDRDTTTSKKAWQQLYQEIHNSQVDILVGTQMLAKGHDFARLTLVIGLNLDNALFSPDYHSGVDMYNGLTQIAGRAGRAETPGKVLLQTDYPDHPVYQFLQQHDFNGFVNYTLKERYDNKLPPFSHSAIIRLSTHREPLLKEVAQELRAIAHKISHTGVTLFPPQPAIIYKLHRKFRAQMEISAASRRDLHDYLNQLISSFTPPIKKVTIAIDVDPIEI